MSSWSSGVRRHNRDRVRQLFYRASIDYSCSALSHCQNCCPCDVLLCSSVSLEVFEINHGTQLSRVQISTEQRCLDFLYAYFIDVRLSEVSGLCGLTVERSLAILKVAGSNLGRSASR